MSKLYDKSQLMELVELLNKGGIVAFPTDTVYGIACRYDCIEALEKLKRVKGREESKPIPFMCSSLEDILNVAMIKKQDLKIIQQLMPGALTIVAQKRPEVLPYITNGLDTIGIRIPDDPFVLRLITEVNVPLLVSSANQSGLPAALTHQEVIEQLGDGVDGIVKGISGLQMASTIVDLTDGYNILRQGPITKEMILHCLKEEV